jgi:hypothetical protein
MVQFERSALQISPRPDNNTTTKTALLKKSAGITSQSPGGPESALEKYEEHPKA